MKQSARRGFFASYISTDVTTIDLFFKVPYFDLSKLEIWRWCAPSFKLFPIFQLPIAGLIPAFMAKSGSLGKGKKKIYTSATFYWYWVLVLENYKLF